MLLMADRPTTSRWAPLTWGERSYQVRPILEGKNRGRHFVRKTPHARGVRVLWSQTSVQPSTLREPSLARAPEIQHRECFEHLVPADLYERNGDVALIPF